MEDNKEDNRRTDWKELSPLWHDSVIVWKAKWWRSICHLGKLRHQRTQWVTPRIMTTATLADRLVMSWHQSQICLLANDSVGSRSHRSELRNRYDLPVYLNIATVSLVNTDEDSLMFITVAMSLLWLCHNSVLLVYVYPFRYSITILSSGLDFQEKITACRGLGPTSAMLSSHCCHIPTLHFSWGDMPGKQCGHTGGRLYLKWQWQMYSCHYVVMIFVIGWTSYVPREHSCNLPTWLQMWMRCCGRLQKCSKLFFSGMGWAHTKNRIGWVPFCAG